MSTCSTSFSLWLLPLLLMPACPTLALLPFAVEPLCQGAENALWYLPAPRTCIEHDGDSRCWYTYKPKSTDETEPVPIVIDLHPYRGCAQGSPRYTGWKKIADENGFALVWPQGTIETNLLFSHTCWDAGESCCCHRWKHQSKDDVGFLQQVIANVASSVNIDTKRIYLAGHSNGCMMAQRMAMESSKLIAAVACHAGVLTTATTPADFYKEADDFDFVPIMTISGDSDRIVPYDGSRLDTFPGVEESMAMWAQANGCSTYENVTDASDLYATHIWSDCYSDNVSLEVVQLFGVGHFPYKDAKYALRQGTSVDTTSIAWDFVSRFSKKYKSTLPPCDECPTTANTTHTGSSKTSPNKSSRSNGNKPNETFWEDRT